MFGLSLVEVVLILVALCFAGVAVYRGVKHAGGYVPFLVTGFVLLIASQYSPDSIELLGAKIEISGPARRDINLDIASVSEEISASELSVYLVPTENKGAISGSGASAQISFNAIPEGVYELLVMDESRRYSLQRPESVGRSTSTLNTIARFPEQVSVTGVVRKLGDDAGARIPVAIGDQVAWSDSDGRFTVFGLEQEAEYDISILGDVVSTFDVDHVGYENNVDQPIFAPQPVVHARVCQSIEIRETQGGSDRWICDEGDLGHFPSDIGELWFYTVIEASPPTAIVHRWEYGNDIVDVVLEVDSQRFRTRSSRQIPPDKTGTWTVRVMTSDGLVELHSQEFRVGSN